MFKEHITISEPKKILIGKLIGAYNCKVYLPNMEKKIHPIYADSPVNAIDNAKKFVKIYLEGRIEFLENLLNEKGFGKRLTKELD